MTVKNALATAALLCAVLPACTRVTEAPPDRRAAAQQVRVDRSICSPPTPEAAAATTAVIELELPDDEVEGGKMVGLGAGIVINRRGQVLTALHVVARAKTILAAPMIADETGKPQRNGPRMPMRIAATAQDYDAALLEPVYPEHRPDIAPARFERWPTKEGETVYGLLLFSSWRMGEVLHNDYPMPEFATIVQNSLPSRSGDSGSPIVNACGNVVGFMSRGYPQETSFYIPALPALFALGVLPEP